LTKDGKHYDMANRRIAPTDTSWDRNNFKTVVIRDMLGRTTSLTDASGNVTRFFYGLDAVSGEERDSVAYPDGTWEVTVTDKAGRVIQKLDKRGVSQSFVYGNDWNVNIVRYEMATKPTLEVVYTRNAKGQVEKIERTEGGATTAKTEYTFDDAGRVLAQTQTVVADVKTTSYAYDMVRRSVILTLPDGTTRTKVLDSRGRLDSVYLDGAMVADYFYDNNKHTGTIFGNGIEAAYGRDVAGRLTSMAYGENGQTPILRHDLGWDVAGQLTWTKKVPDAIADERYGMDKQGQLTEWKTGLLDVSNAITAPTDSLGWNLDARGNWTNVYDSKATVDTRTHSGANAVNVRNGVTFVYDDAGNLLSDGVNSYEWTLDGLLAKVTNASGITEYGFDGQRRLIKREQKNASGTVVDASMYYWSGWQLEQEVRNNIPRTFAYGNYIDDQIAMKTAGSTFYFHRSYNQSAEAVTDASGDLVERYIETNPYGGYVIQDASGNTLAVSSIGNRSVFQGAPLTDNVSGMVYLRNRWYSPTLGRFVSRDPAGMPDGVNRYSLVNSTPHSAVDPFGYFSQNPFDANVDGLGIVSSAYAYMVAYLSGSIPSDLAKRLLAHYFWGDGSLLTLSESEVKMLHPELSIANTRELSEWANSNCKECGNKVVSGDFSGMVGKQRSRTDQVRTKGTLGNYSIKLTGKLACDCQSWNFSGSIVVQDFWDFDIRMPFNSGRPFMADMKVALMNLTSGVPFSVIGTVSGVEATGRLYNGCK
jgi:RHS repeat-associated protein